jgi:hypothetical protein
MNYFQSYDISSICINSICHEVRPPRLPLVRLPTLLVPEPRHWVSHRLFYDCVRAKIIEDDVIRLKYAHGCTEIVDFDFFYDLDVEIEDSLCDLWLSDIGIGDYEEFEECRVMTEESITWDLTEFWEFWHDVDCDGTVKELSAKEKLAYDKVWNGLSVKHEIERAAIEAEAVRIGL